MASVIRRNRQVASTLQVGAWTCLQRLGRGRWSDVFLARPTTCDSDWPADYAVKVARPGDVELATALMAREALVAGQVQHPQVVSVLSMDLEHQPPYLVMPFVGRCALENLLPHGPLRLSQSLWFARQIADGLRAIHAAGWIHADLQPGNIVVSKEGHATLVDLGLARNSAHEGITNSAISGRLPYIAPEMFSSSLTAEPASDVYSLGVVLFEMLTGGHPFTVTRPADWVEAHLSARPHDPRFFRRKLRSGLAELVNKMLAKQPLRRPSASELVRQLTKLEIEHFSG